MFQLFFNLGQAADDLRLFGDRLRLVLLEELGSRFIGGGFGLLQQRFRGREIVQRLAQLAHRLVDFRLLFDHLLDGLFRELLGLANFLAELFLFLQQVADHLQRLFAVAADQPLGLFDLFQQRPQALDHGFLAFACVVELGRRQRRVGFVQLLADLSRFQNPQAVGRAGAGLAAPIADVHQRIDQHQEQRFHVQLILDRRLVGGIAIILRDGGQRLCGDQRPGFHGDQLPDLSRDLGDLQAAEQLLPLGHQPHDDFANLAASLVDDRRLLVLAHFLRLDQQLDDALHFLLDQAVDVAAHLADFFEDGQFRQPVLLELPNLDLEDAGDQFTGQRPRFLLGLLFAAQRVDLRAAACWQNREERRQRHDESGNPFHLDSPIPNCCLMMSVSRCSDFSSASEMAANTPASSEISRTNGSL